MVDNTATQHEIHTPAAFSSDPVPIPGPARLRPHVTRPGTWLLCFSFSLVSSLFVPSVHWGHLVASLEAPARHLEPCNCAWRRFRVPVPLWLRFVVLFACELTRRGVKSLELEGAVPPSGSAIRTERGGT